MERMHGMPAAPRISNRQRECLRWSAEGKIQADIAIILNISSSTVGSHLERAKKNLDCVTRTQAVVKAHQLGLIDVDFSA
jgi:LuxR family quorum-sensing system transcriptional regulator CciR